MTEVQGLHHVTAYAKGAARNNGFFTETLGLRRVKTTVNFDAPDMYHLYYADAVGTPGTVMTYFPIPHAAPGRPGRGEVSRTVFAVPQGSLKHWETRLSAIGEVTRDEVFGTGRLLFTGPDGDRLAVTEATAPGRLWTERVPEAEAITGFHSVELSLGDIGATADVLRLLGYVEDVSEPGAARFRLPGGNGANLIDLRQLDAPRARPGAGSVHHVAFSVSDREAQLTLSGTLEAEGIRVTEQLDRNYFWSTYFRSPGGVLFEIATDGPGFAHDEDPRHLGERLMLPAQHEHLRDKLGQSLEPLQ
ncbi:dioxygenase [Salipiger pallidus]|uniref:Dioxygenase n=1 Tax=Salipiger pallidus TaxID=1775170 RepID=A0A8J3EFK9_9RHOB|nr:VOC family protein [Salipiger pallidus]GGG70746.1 dioxygenase [Salipiger pallidus]